MSRSWQKGDLCRYWHEDGMGGVYCHAVVTKINRVTVGVFDEDGRTLRIKPHHLEEVPEHRREEATNAIREAGFDGEV